MSIRPLEPAEINISYYPDDSDGGIHVRMVHIATGLEVTATTTPFAHENKALAIEELTQMVNHQEGRAVTAVRDPWFVTLSVVVVGYSVTTRVHVEADNAAHAAEVAVLGQMQTDGKYQKGDWSYEVDESSAYKVSSVQALTPEQSHLLKDLNF